MKNLTEKNYGVNRWFLVFVLVHFTLWTLAPSWARWNLPLDSIEGTVWANHLNFGYDKNPYLSAWVTALAIQIGGPSGVGTYFMSQLFVLIAFWSIWELGKKIFSPQYALIAVYLLEGIQYYNFHAIDLSDNVIGLGLWPLTILAFYLAISENKLKYWLATGFFAGLSMMAKYYAVMLLVPMFALLIYVPDFRRYFKQTSLYLALAMFAIVTLPHFFWAYSHDFITLHYALDRTAVHTVTWTDHFYYPMLFIIQQAETLLPPVLLLSILYIGKKAQPMATRPTCSRIQGTFLIFIGLGPFIITVFLSLMTGITLRAAWGQPLFSLWGLLLIYWLRPILYKAAYYRFLVIVLILLLLAVGSYAISMLRGASPSSANFPGDRIAHQLDQTWHARFYRPVKYIAGTRWLAGTIAFYSSDHPSVFIDWDKAVSPWIDENDIAMNGAIFVWDLSPLNRQTIVSYEDVKKRWPSLEEAQVMHFSWYRNLKLTPVTMMVAILPPKG